MPDSTFPAGPGRFQDPAGTPSSMQAGHIFVLMLIYIKYTKKREFDNYAAM